MRLLTSEGVQNRRLGESKGNIAETSAGQHTCLRYPEVSRLRTAVAAVTACGSTAVTPTLATATVSTHS